MLGFFGCTSVLVCRQSRLLAIETDLGISTFCFQDGHRMKMKTLFLLRLIEGTEVTMLCFIPIQKTENNSFTFRDSMAICGFASSQSSCLNHHKSCVLSLFFPENFKPQIFVRGNSHFKGTTSCLRTEQPSGCCTEPSKLIEPMGGVYSIESGGNKSEPTATQDRQLAREKIREYSWYWP